MATVSSPCPSLRGVLLVEGDDVVRTEISIFVESEPIETPVVACGDVWTAREVICSSALFDVAVVELDVPGGLGLDVIRGLRQIRPACPIIVFTALGDDTSLFDALRAGATGFVTKPTSPAALHAAIVEAFAGGAPLSPAIARRVVTSFAAPLPTTSELTPREREVLALLARGHTYPDVATALGLGLGTVQGYVKSLYRKIEVSSKAEAAAYASRLGLG